MRQPHVTHDVQKVKGILGQVKKKIPATCESSERGAKLERTGSERDIDRSLTFY